jgi:putative transposase
MARPARIEFPGAFYHVTSRGNRKQPIFLSDEDRYFFLNCLCEAHERFQAVFHVYCLMDNHYHLLLGTPNGDLSRIMHFINLKYAVYFNLKHGHSGHTFQARFRATVIQAGGYAREAACYIHLNPVRAGLVQTPEDFEWSNCRDFFGLRPPYRWTDRDFLLSLFGPDPAHSCRAYESFVRTRLGQRMDDPLAPAEKTGILGDRDFISLVMKAHSRRPATAAQNDRASLSGPLNRPDLRQVLKESEETLGERSRLARNLAIYVSHTSTDHSLGAISAFFGIGGSGISDICRRMKKEMAFNETLSRTVREIAGKLTGS